jgi:hypothetical protein
MREALAVHRIYIAGGVSPDDIFVSYSGGHFQVVAKQGQLEYRMLIGRLDLRKHVFAEKWQEATAAYNAMSPIERTSLVDGTQAREVAVNILAGLLAKGFKRDA